MPRYEVVFSRQAAARLRATPATHRKTILDKLDQLALAPVTLSEKADSPPYPAGYQVFKIFIADEKRHLYSVLFNYGSNERELIVAVIGHVEYAD